MGEKRYQIFKHAGILCLFWTGGFWSIQNEAAKIYLRSELPITINGTILMENCDQNPAEWEYVSTCGINAHVLEVPS